MNDNIKKNSPLVFYILGFLTALLFELYWIGNFPYDYFMLIGIGLIVLITGYLTFDGVIKAYNEAQEIKREQNEIMIKAQKAIYLATKKNSAEAEKMQINSLKAVNILMDRMVDTLTEKQLTAKADEANDISGLIEKLSKSNKTLAKKIQNAITVGKLVKSNEELIKSVQDILNGSTEELSENIHGSLTETALQSDHDYPDENTQDEALSIDMETDGSDIDSPMDNDIASAEAAIADMSHTAEAMEAAADLGNDPGTAMSPEEIEKLFNNI